MKGLLREYSGVRVWDLMYAELNMELPFKKLNDGGVTPVNTSIDLLYIQ